MSTFHKAIRPDGGSFWSPSFKWSTEPGGVTVHPNPGPPGCGADGSLSVSTVPTDCIGMGWPARHLVVEPVEGHEVWHRNPVWLAPRKRASTAWRTVEERPGWELLGPQGAELVDVWDRLRHVDYRDAVLLVDPWETVEAYRLRAWRTAEDCGMDGDRHSAWSAAIDVAYGLSVELRGLVGAAVEKTPTVDAIRAATAGLMVRDLVDPDVYATLTGPAASVLGRLHPDDPEARQEVGV